MSEETGKKEDLYRQYLHQKHAQFNTPDEIIAEEIRKATKSFPKSKERLILGEQSEVYKIETEDGQKVIIRISRHKNLRFEAEQWAIEQSRVKGVPVPKILLTDRIVADGEALGISIQEEINGATLAEMISNLSQDDMHNIVNKAGEVLSKIHSVETTGFGYLDEYGMGAYTSWDKFILSLLSRKEKLIAAAKRVKYDTSKIKEAVNILERNLGIFDGVKSKLLHSDFSPKHIFISQREIVGIIDFEGCKGGDPVRDFAWWDYFSGDKLPVDWLQEGYTDKELFRHSTFDKRFTLTKLHLGLGMLEYYEMEKNQSGIEYGKNNSTGYLSLILTSPKGLEVHLSKNQILWLAT